MNHLNIALLMASLSLVCAGAFGQEAKPFGKLVTEDLEKNFINPSYSAKP